jgi:hypothetical protein
VITGKKKEEMTRKLFFRNSDSERCHEIQYFKDELKDSGMTEMYVFRAIPDKSDWYFWCRAIGDACANDDTTCGKDCEDYDPCNKKSGKCRFKTHCYVHGEKVLLKP